MKLLKQSGRQKAEVKKGIPYNSFYQGEQYRKSYNGEDFIVTILNSPRSVYKTAHVIYSDTQFPHEKKFMTTLEIASTNVDELKWVRITKRKEEIDAEKWLDNFCNAKL